MAAHEHQDRATAGKAIVLGPSCDEREAARRAAFIERAFPPQEQNAARVVLESLAANGIPHTISDLYGNDSRGGPYRGATEPRASRPGARRRTQAIDAQILGEPALAAGRAAYLDIVPGTIHGSKIWTLKGALLLPPRGRLAPVEISQVGKEFDLHRLIADFFERLVRHERALPVLTNDPSEWLVNAMLFTSLRASMEWTGRVSGAWLPQSDHFVEWFQPANADLFNVADAVELDAEARDERSGFAWMHGRNRRLLVFYGPTELNRYYVHRSRRALAERMPSKEVIERRFVRWVETIEQQELSLADFPAERLAVGLDRPNSFAYVTRRILRLNQLPLTSEEPAGPLSLARDDDVEPAADAPRKDAYERPLDEEDVG
jgi:hypothetical protein